MIELNDVEGCNKNSFEDKYYYNIPVRLMKSGFSLLDQIKNEFDLEIPNKFLLKNSTYISTPIELPANKKVNNEKNERKIKKLFGSMLKKCKYIFLTVSKNKIIYNIILTLIIIL